MTLVFMYLRLLGHPRYCVGKWKLKHSERRLKSLFKEHYTSVSYMKSFSKSLGCISSKMFYTLNWIWILLVSWSSLQNTASFSVEQPKSAIKLELLNWPPWITASARNSIPTRPSWSSWNYFLFACSTPFKEHKELGW